MPEIVHSWGLLVLVAGLGYLLGSVPFGVVVSRLFGLADPRGVGSGNIGATNVLRSGNKVAAALTLILDAGKGGVAVLIARAALGEDAAQAAGGAAFLGHLFPVWLGFRGGKGVATFLGVILALAPLAGLAACATWVGVAALFRISSLAALVAAGMAPVWLMLTGDGRAALLGAGLALLVWLRHWQNIGRLRRGEEPKFGRGH